MTKISKQLEAKLTLRIALFLIAIAAFVYFYFVNSFENETLEKFRYKAKVFSNYLEQNPQIFKDGKLWDRSQIIKLIELTDAKYLALEDSNGLIVDAVNIDLAESNFDLATKKDESISQNHQIFHISLPIIANKLEIGKIYVGFYALDTIAHLHQKKLLTALISLLILLLGIIITFFLASQSFKPLSKLNLTLDRSIKENENIEINYSGHDEIELLADKINSVLMELDVSSERVESLNTKLKGDFKEKVHELEYEINQKKQARISQQASEKQFRLLFENAPIGMVIVSPDMKIKSVNKSFCSTLGYGIDELLGLGIENLFGRDTPNDSINGNAKLNAEELQNPSSNQIIVKKDKTKIQVIVKSDTICDDKNQPKQHIMQVLDITEIIRVQKELGIALEKAKEASKLKDAFLAQMSHEIRTPLNVILTSVPILADEIGDKDKDTQIIISSVGSAGKRLQRTIDMILNMSAVQSGNYQADFEQIDLAEDLQRLTAEFKSLADDKGLNLEFRNLTENPVIKLDSYTVNQIFQNLIGNAVKYTKKGFIRIVIKDAPNDKLMVFIEDSGIGMSQEFMQNIFTPFSQEDIGQKREYEGNGLGLALVKKYSEVNNATLTVESKKGVGSIFSVTFNRDANIVKIEDEIVNHVVGG
ncbi:MAG: PAS domain-containing sensor histidine kinase [Ignavibacteria bacterium]|nr:PAS domain-containing sensor histidine kinase [Ignavibacteria bacterium]